MEYDNHLGPRENPAQRLAASLEQMPPVPPVNPLLEHQFVKLLEDEHSPHDEHNSQHNPEAASETNNLRQIGFRYLVKMLMSRAFIAQQYESKQKQVEGIVKNEFQNSGQHIGTFQNKSIDIQLLRFGRALLDGGAASDLSNELAECISGAASFGLPWQAEVTLSNRVLPATRLLIAADETLLHLHFVSADSRACDVLREQRDLLKATLSRVSKQTVQVEIDAVLHNGSDSSHNGGIT